jgi:Na+/phosphate symporter
MPGEALKEIKKELYLMLHKSREMLELTEDAFAKNKVSPLDQAEELAREIHDKEDVLTEKLAKLASSNPEARAIISVPAHIEKIASTIKRIQDNTRTRIKEGMLFSDKAIQETSTMFAKTKDVLKKAGEVAVTGAKKGVEEITAESDAIERMVNEFTTAHENRIITGEASPKSSTVFLCILYAFEDMAAHIKNAVRKISV